MHRRLVRNSRATIFVSVMLLLIVAMACGSSATATPRPTSPSAPAATAAPAATIVPAGIAAPVATTVPAATTAPRATQVPAPVATMAPTPTTAVRDRPYETINVGQKELGVFEGHPKLVKNPALFVSQTAPIGEALAHANLERKMVPWLTESWSISEDFMTWTFKIRKGVQFHKGYGEMTAEDVIWSYSEGWAENELHVRNPTFRSFWQAEGGSATAPDPYTIVVNTGTPLSELVMLQDWMGVPPAGSANWVVSKKQTEEIGVEAANRDIAATGSWEIVEHKPAEFWRMRAVEDHWRQTPYFAELTFWEVPEESARLAGFQTGTLDTYLMAFDSIPAIEAVPGAKFVSVPGAIDVALLFYGNYLVEAGTADSRAAYDPDLAWISSNADLDSPEWERARKVREALSIAIDRELIIETVLRGFARPIALRYWGNHEEQLKGRHWEFDPERAKQLLEEAGYPDGFKITLTPAIRGAPAETETCEAIFTMWGDIGIDVDFQRVPYGTLRPTIVGRTYQGATCHAVGARSVTPGLFPQLTVAGSFNHGATHPFFEDIMPRIAGALDREELDLLTGELGIFLFDNALTQIGFYSVDAIWPVGPRLEPWAENVKTGDLRNINGYEWIQHRK